MALVYPSSDSSDSFGGSAPCGLETEAAGPVMAPLWVIKGFLVTGEFLQGIQLDINLGYVPFITILILFACGVKFQTHRMSQRARDTLARATPQNPSKAKKAEASKNSRVERLAERNTSKTVHASQEQNEGSEDEGRPLQRKRTKPYRELASDDDEMESSGAVVSEAAGSRKLKKQVRVEPSATATQVFTEFMVSFEWIAVI